MKNELDRMLKEIEEVYKDEKDEGMIEDIADKQLFIDEMTNLYLEKIGLGQWDKLNIFVQFAHKHNLKKYKILNGRMNKQGELITMDKAIVDYIARHLRNEIGEIVENN